MPKVAKFVAQQQRKNAGEKMLHSATSSYIGLQKATKMSSNSIDETCQLVGASRWTIYRMIDKGSLKVGKLGSRTIIKRQEIDKLFK